MADIRDMLHNLQERFDNIEKDHKKDFTKFQQIIKEKDKKINELQNICMIYVENIYNFIGNLNVKHLDNFENVNLSKLKLAVDSCISDDTFKAYLQHKYIEKNYEKYMKTLGEVAEKNLSVTKDNISVDFMRDNLEDDYTEDDTETIKIVNRKNNSKKHLTKGVKYYNVKTKSFIDNSPDKIDLKAFEEAFKEENK